MVNVKHTPRKQAKPKRGVLFEIRREQKSTKMAISRVHIARYVNWIKKDILRIHIFYASVHIYFLCIRDFL